MKARGFVTTRLGSRKWSFKNKRRRLQINAEESLDFAVCHGGKRKYQSRTYPSVNI
jgi:hypothetical protein